MFRSRFGFRRKPSESDFERELLFHIEQATSESILQGMTPEQARRRAFLELGGQEQAAQAVRDVHSLPWLERFAANLKSGLRLIRRSPGFSAAVMLTLALGIGANTAVFSAIDAVLLRPLPFPHADELMLLRQKNTRRTEPFSFVAPVRLEDWNRLNSTFQAMTGYYTESASESSGELPEKLTLAFVAPRFLQVWGISPQLGRDFTPEEEKFGGRAAVLISDSLWRRQFNADPAVTGKVLRLDRRSYTVVGVLPASFLFPVRQVEVWSPIPPDSPYAQGRDATWYTVIGRLQPGVQPAQAQADLAKVQAQLGKQFPKPDAELAVEVSPLKEHAVSAARRSLWMLFGSVTLLLLIACTNISALLLARTSEREHEIAVRFSLGASRRSLIGQLLTETFLLALAGAGLGLLVAFGAARIFRALAASLPRVDEIAVDWRIAAYALVTAVIVTLTCGLLPAWRTTSGLSGSLARNSKTQVSGHHPLQWGLVAVQVALAVTLLFGAGLLLRSFQELGRVWPGFDATHVLTLHISASWGETTDPKALNQRINRILDTLRSVPGVDAAATAAALPGIPGEAKAELKIVEGAQDPNHAVFADNRFVSQGYFSTMSIPMLAGEPCNESENKAVVVNRNFADRYFPAGSAIGHHLTVGQPPLGVSGEIVGIAAAAREQGLSSEPMPTAYWCMAAPVPDPHFLVRTRGEPQAMADTLRRVIHQIEPSRSVFDVAPLEQHLDGAFAETRMRTILLSLFALTAISLACTGIYGTLSYMVSLRHREIGLRLALGAKRPQIVKLYFAQALRVAVIGCVCGLILFAGLVHMLSAMLFGVSSFDPATLIGVVALVLIVAAMAALIPAFRASRTDPMNVLREQ